MDVHGYCGVIGVIVALLFKKSPLNFLKIFTLLAPIMITPHVNTWTPPTYPRVANIDHQRGMAGYPSISRSVWMDISGYHQRYPWVYPYPCPCLLISHLSRQL